MAIEHRRRFVRRTPIVAAAAVLALAAACSSSGTKSSSSTTVAKSSSSGTVAKPPAAATTAGVIVGSANGKSPCEKALPVAASPGEVGTGTGGSGGTADAEHGPRGALVQLPLTHAERTQLAAQMNQAATTWSKYPTVKQAEAAGYAESTPYVPCIGAHYTNVGLAGSFNPATPSELLYDGTTPDSKLVGLSYLVNHNDGPPPGFAGPNDHWHQHNANGGLCLKGGLVVGGEETTQAECAARGGHKTILANIWMLHAWIVPGWECSWGVFSGECPELGGKIGVNAWTS